MQHSHWPCLLLATLPLTALSGTAQKLAWQIPHRGVIVYSRTSETKPRNMFSGGYLPGFNVRNPAVLLYSDLDTTRRYLVQDPANLWELAMHVAFDLRTAARAGKIDETFGFMPDFGSVRITGEASAVGGDGRQRIKLALSRVPLPADKFPPKVLEFVNKFNPTTLTGTLRIERVIDAVMGRIYSFESDLNAMVGKQSARLKEKWRFGEAKPCRYPGFRVEVAKAIETGAAYIKGQIRDVNTPALAAGPDKEGKTVSSGLLALCLLTVIKAEANPKDPIVVQGFDALRQRELTDSYSLSIALLAFEALYAPPDERRMLIEGRIKAPLPRTPSAGDKALMRKWVDRLLANRDLGIRDVSKFRRFNYLPNRKRYDNSTTQYALLGLYSAHLCGVRVPRVVWLAMANHWLTDRIEDGKPRSIKLVSHTQYAKMRAKAKGRGHRRTGSAGRRVQPTGWPYMTIRTKKIVPTMPLTGSMTAAGVTGLAICEAVLRAPADKVKRQKQTKKERAQARQQRHEELKAASELLRKITHAKEQGYAWLLDNYSVRCNKHHHGFGFHFYYLYGMERACELSQVALIGDHDWYFDGATMLLGMQQSHGEFKMTTLYANCFAVLFLKQAAPPLPVITGPRRR